MVWDIKRLLQLITSAWGQSDTLIDKFYTFSVISTEILRVRATQWTKWKLGKAPNESKCFFCHVIMSVVDIRGCSGQTPPTILLLNHYKLGQKSLSRLLWSKWRLSKASYKLVCTFYHVVMSVKDISGCSGHNIASEPLTWSKFTLKASMVKMKAW